jgi:predicted NAD/FAD-binding protein
MNCLQGVSDRTDYFVSINGADLIRPEHVLRTIDYEHPLFSLGAIQAQRGLPRLNARSPDQAIYFAGSYFRFGFHEDALGSAVACARSVAGGEVWPGA